MSDKSPIIIAIDTTEIDKGRDLLKKVHPYVSVFKVGLEFFLAHGADGVEKLRNEAPNLDLFLDLKLHDIPNTVRGAANAISRLAPTFLTVHASGGGPMIQSAAVALPGTKITAVTVLTSLDKGEFGHMGFSEEIAELTSSLARNAVENGARALVCSPLEVSRLRNELGDDVALITPGVRPNEQASRATKGDDQKRTMTPREAIASGADFLVIGRPISASENPAEAARKILDELAC